MGDSFSESAFQEQDSYFDVDDLIYEPQKGENWSEDKVRRMKERFRKNLELYTGVITSTDFIKNELHRSFPDIDIAVHVIHDPVDTAIFSPVTVAMLMPALSSAGSALLPTLTTC